MLDCIIFEICPLIRQTEKSGSLCLQPDISEKKSGKVDLGACQLRKKYNVDFLRCFGDCTEESQNTQESRGMKAMTTLHPKSALQTDEGNSGSRYVNWWNRTSTAHMQELTECNCCT